jgi:hypothetical protein
VRTLLPRPGCVLSFGVQEHSRDVLGSLLSNRIPMNHLTSGLVLGVFGICCLLGWSMLTLMSDVQQAGRVLPFFTQLSITLRPALLVLPVAAAVWKRGEERVSHWLVFVASTMGVLIVFVLPLMSTSYLLMIDQVRLASGAGA